MNQPHNLSEAIDFAIAQDWWVIILVVVVPITIAVLLKKFEKWVWKKDGKIKNKKRSLYE